MKIRSIIRAGVRLTGKRQRAAPPSSGPSGHEGIDEGGHASVVRPPAGRNDVVRGTGDGAGDVGALEHRDVVPESPTAATSLISWSRSARSAAIGPASLDSPAAVTSTKAVERVRVPSTTSSRPQASASATRGSGTCSGIEVTPRPATWDRGAAVKRSAGVRWSVDRPIGSSSTRSRARGSRRRRTPAPG